MKPIIIPRDKVLEVLLRGHEVLHIEYHYNNKPSVTKLTSISIAEVMDIIETSSKSDFFVAMVESEEDIPADTPPTTEQPEDNTTEENNTEVNTNE